MTPIVCVGEGLDVRQAGEHVGYTLAQVDGSLAGFTAEQVAGLVVAYEPVWAIGTGEVATPEDAQEVCAAIRGPHRARCTGPTPAAAIRILYGGSVKAANVGGIMAKPDVDGCLVGGASLQADEFGGICRFYDMPVHLTRQLSNGRQDLATRDPTAFQHRVLLMLHQRCCSSS